MHSTGLRIQPSVVFAGAFAEYLGISRKLVPEAIEINALASGNQPLHVGATKPEMPQKRVLEYFFPRPDTRQRRVHKDEAGDPVRILRGEGVSRPYCRCRGR